MLLLLLYLLASKYTEAFTQCTFAQAFKKTAAAGCQRGTNTCQCWPPLQLNDTLQVHKYTKSIKNKKKNIASIQVDESPCAEKIHY